MTKATVIYVENQPQHSDIMDLIGEAHVGMVAALPLALAADNPVKYLTSVGALCMKRYCFYNDPLVRRPRYRGDSYEHTTTVSMEGFGWPVIETIAGPDVQLTAEEAEEWTMQIQDQIVCDALNQLNPRYRDMLTTYYGLYGQSAKRTGDIAEELQMNKKAVEHVIRRAKAKVAEKLAPYMLEQTQLGQKSPPDKAKLLLGSVQ